ncbi:HAD family hydrolase [Singulisphaera acidiphila]|uniref:Haloacid dehalogenase superfamily enzyme, subfamily IA n=1 Tax=Singulisphaera acidiphila (strain ATCC BAA-1392 / DSM 18658 / VKM B-2454 / MOB10) TaxID=886293 RepID=L0DKS3_SINAD|nr:HAD family hydrolase [Singulisphaera acidiphila]AGA29448.1 haloacid dehalogenase superfamily enzyme, subfamily IA [Singulisphaera acidiphila DSM 18658]
MTTCIEAVWDGIEAIVLDAVGTLIEPVPTVAEVYASAARRQGVDLDREVVRTRFAQSFRDDENEENLEALATDEPTESIRWRRIVSSVLPELPEPDRAFEELWEHFGRPDSWCCFPDVGPSLALLRAMGLPIAIASNFDGRLRTVLAGLPELAACDPQLIISSEVGYRKPHPAFYQAICECLGQRPETLLMIGDDPENDVLGACRAGLRGVWLDRRGRGNGGSMRGVAGLGDLVAHLCV